MANPGIGGTLGNASDVNFPTLRQAGDFLYYDDGYWRNYQLLPSNNKLSVTKDTANGRVSVGVNEGNLDIAAIGGTLTAPQLPLITPTKLDTNGDTPANGELLSYNGASQKFEWVAPPTSQAAVDQKLAGFYNVKEFKCDDGQYVKGDGMHDDTTGVQRALDTASGALFFPSGIYRITNGLTLSRNLDLVGFSKRDSVIRGDFFPATTDILTVAITDNGGYLDVRNWRIENLSLSLNGGGRHALHVVGGMQILGSKIENCGLSGFLSNGGYGLMIQGNFAHGRITQCAFDSIYLGCYDANVIDKNLFFGNRPAVTFDLINGIRNNVVRDNTAVNRDGTVHIINGSNIRIHNNQFEHMAGQGTNQSLFSCMVWIEGRDRACTNIVITENNFGGGTNLNRSVYIDNAHKTIIEKNHFVAVNTADIEVTANAKNTIIKSDNTTLTQVVNPRTDDLISVKVIDNGIGTVGVVKTPILQNNWTGGSFLKDEAGMVHFYDTVASGTMTAGTILFTLPKFFRPKANANILAISDSGIERLRHTSYGNIVAVSVNSNVNLSIMSFAASEDVETNQDIIVSDSFNRTNALSLGAAETGQTWQVGVNNLQILDNAVSLIANSPADTAIIDCGQSNCTVSATFKTISTGYTKTCKLIFRYVDASNYLYLTAFDLSGYRYSIFQVIAGVESRVWGTNLGTYADGDIVKVVLVGSIVTFYLNGTQVVQRTITDFSTATKHGFGLSSATQSAIDDFKITI